MNATEGLEMLEAAKRKGIIHLVNYEFRTVPARVEMRRRVQEGFIGQLMHVHVVTFSDAVRATDGRMTRWWYEAKAGGGRLGAAGSHTIDALRFIFGEITGVGAQLDAYAKDVRVLGGETVHPDVDDTFFLLFRFANGAMGAYLTGTAIVAGGSNGMRIEAYGTEGTLALEGDSLFAARKGERTLQPVPVAALQNPPSVRDPHYAPFWEWTRRIVAAVQEGRQIEPSFFDGWRSQQIIDAARRSQAEGRWIGTAL
jgi:predicted dehydrogenase